VANSRKTNQTENCADGGFPKHNNVMSVKHWTVNKAICVIFFELNSLCTLPVATAVLNIDDWVSFLT